MTPPKPQVRQGRCLCGACRFELTGPELWVAHCHCQSCRRASGAAFVTWIGMANGQWRFSGTPPVTYASSPGTTRGFCATCGTPVFYRSDRWPAETHFCAVLLDDAADLVPTHHDHADERLAWVHLGDCLPHAPS